MFKKAKKTYRAIKGASIAVSAGLGAGREIVTLCVRGALLTTQPGFCHGVAEGASMERDTGRNTVKSVQGQIRLAHWNRWSFIGCMIMSRILWNWMQHVNTCTWAYNTHTHTHREHSGWRWHKAFVLYTKRNLSLLMPESLVMWERSACSLMLQSLLQRIEGAKRSHARVNALWAKKHWGVCWVTKNPGIVQLSTRQQPQNSTI